MVGLGDLPGGDFYSLAYGVSADGSVIVGQANTGSEEAFLWTPSLGMVNLRDYLMAHGVRGLESWRLIRAFDVSADGLTIVGAGSNGVYAEAWMATIPEPSAIVLSAIGAILAGFALLRRCAR
jgi:probable HAF family extracellular repeat protein